MKMFVTGGTGFVGSHFVNKATVLGHEVIAQRRPGSEPRIELHRQPYWVDRAMDEDFSDFLQGCDVFVHFAAHTPNPPYAPLPDALYWNVYATSRILQQAVDNGVKKFLIAGTCFEYGSAANNQEYVHPGTAMRPINTYAISKAAATTACVGLARNLNLKMEILRIFQVFGEGEANTRFWPALREAAMSGSDFPMSVGTQIRDFINVRAVADAFYEALELSAVVAGQPQVRNIGTGRAQSLFEFACEWWEYWNASGRLLPGKVPLREGEIDRLVPDIHSVYLC